MVKLSAVWNYSFKSPDKVNETINICAWKRTNFGPIEIKMSKEKISSSDNPS